jgi:hypothetical protein
MLSLNAKPLRKLILTLYKFLALNRSFFTANRNGVVLNNRGARFLPVIYMFESGKYVDLAFSVQFRVCLFRWIYG